MKSFGLFDEDRHHDEIVGQNNLVRRNGSEAKPPTATEKNALNNAMFNGPAATSAAASLS